MTVHKPDSCTIMIIIIIITIIMINVNDDDDDDGKLGTVKTEEKLLDQKYKLIGKSS